MNMNDWIAGYLSGSSRKPIPVLSFPGAQLIGAAVDELVRSGRRQADCMKAIAERYQTGASLSLMDLSVEAEAFGSRISYSKEEVPTVIGALVESLEQAEALSVPNIGAGRTGECLRAIEYASREITDRPVLAGIIGPFSLAGRLLDMTEIMIKCFEEPETVECVLEKATQFLVSYAKALKAAGADGIVMAEPAAGLLSPGMLEEFSNPYVLRVKEAVEDDNFLVVYHNCGSVVPLLGSINRLGMRAYSFGDAIDLEEALKAINPESLVFGNISPALEFRGGTPDSVGKATRELVARCSKYPNFVLSSGCDIPPMSPLENIDAFFANAQW